MKIDQLVKMANQIGGFFEVLPDREEAKAGVAQHLRLYWAPPMRRRLLQHAVEGPGVGLTPFTLEALRGHHAALAGASGAGAPT
jgi:formate dehydrogenase subunit delta